MATLQIFPWEIEALKLYEKGQTAAQIAEKLSKNPSTVRSALSKKYHKLGVVQGSQKTKEGVIVDWAKLELIQKGAAPKKAPSTTGKPQSTTSDVAKIPQSAALPFTHAEIEALKLVAKRELTTGTIERAKGDDSTVSVRINRALVDAIRTYSDREAIPMAEGINRAIEYFLGAQGKA